MTNDGEDETRLAGDATSLRQLTPPTTTPAAEEQRSSPYAFYLAAIALGVAVVAFVATMFVFGELFQDAATVTAALGSLSTLIGTVVGAYCGIKVSSDEPRTR